MISKGENVLRCNRKKQTADTLKYVRNAKKTEKTEKVISKGEKRVKM